ncbi:S8 family serine peptidase [uncultured Aquabacterium sp.]|uniref:S8 family serine peptidase n=1 Tax=uncultured Aquabacterium sp. TaxID=158753 RepID=UPI002605ABE3|nr:S8 family serine peptidase [uncultured Aquabacterium sp.]
MPLLPVSPWRRLGALALSTLLATPLVSQGALAASDLPGTARVIVKLRADSDLATVSQRQAAQGLAADEPRPMRRLGQRAGLALTDGRQVAPRMHVAMANGMTARDLAARLAARSDVEYAVVDGWRRPGSVAEPTDPLFAASATAALPAGQWYLRAPTPTLKAAINAQAAWSTLGTRAGLNAVGSNSVVVAVLDTGVRFDHPDLSSKLISPGYSMVAEGTRAGYPGGGRVADASDLGDWLTQAEINANPSLYDDCEVRPSSSWHGTQVSGVLGASSDNGVGMASVAWEPRLLPVRVLAKCGGYDSDIIAGMRWAAGLSVNGVSALSSTSTARVINLSLGGTGACSAAYRDVVAELTARNVVVVASAGNSNGAAVTVPANCPGVIAVGGLRHVGTKVGYSALGPEVTLGAPSGNCVNSSSDSNCEYPILTTLNSGTTTPVTGSSGAIYSSSTRPTYGTSFAAPQVSGAVALLLSARPELTPAAVAQILRNTARAFPSAGGSSGTPQCTAPVAGTKQLECHCTETTCGAGMLDVGQAVAAVDQPVAVVSTGGATLYPGRAITLSGAGSMGSTATAQITSHSWSLRDGGGIVTALSGDTSTVSVTATPSAAGTFKVRLTVTDDQGRTGTSDHLVHVASAVVAQSSSTEAGGSSGGGGGGGRIDVAALLALMLVCAVAANRRPARALRAPARSR